MPSPDPHNHADGAPTDRPRSPQTQPRSQPRLRLVLPDPHVADVDDAAPRTARPPRRAPLAPPPEPPSVTPRSIEALEPRRQPLTQSDPRWALAVAVWQRLDGSVLTPAHRTQLNRLARSLGLTPFQASLVIAVVQDEARRGLTLSDAAATLAFIPVTSPARRRLRSTILWCLLLLALEIALLIHWFS
jgi:hypothetical protein